MSTRNRREPWFYAGVGRVEEAVRQRDEERRLEAMAQARPWPEGLWDAVNAKLDAMETQTWLVRDRWNESVRETLATHAWTPVLGWGGRIPRKLKKRLRDMLWLPVYVGNLTCSAPAWNGTIRMEETPPVVVP